jgi:2'-5' RNA ligase
LSATVKGQLHQLQQQLYTLGADVKWVEPNNFHITIKFLGETNQHQVAAIKEALRQSVIGIKSFDLHISKLGAFPARGTPRVIWAGLAGNINSLKMLHRQVEHQLSTIGFEPEKRRFSPHLTLGRVKSNAAHEGLQKAIATIEVLADNFAVNSIELMQSDLTRSRPIYSLLASYGLE